MSKQQLKELAQRATPWPWKWFTSNSHNRLSSVPSGKDGDVISAFKAVDGVACVSVSRADMAFIEAAHPGAVIELITSNEILSHEFEETKQLLRSTREKLTRAIDRNVAKDIEIKRLSAVERERDELRAIAEEQSKLAGSNAGRAQKAEAEIARRDAAAGEPAGWQFLDERGSWLTVTEAGKDTALSQGYSVRPIHTDAPPVVLPPEMTRINMYSRLKERPECDPADGFMWAYNQCRADALALGAQPQRRVVLPEIIRHELIDVLTWIERLPVPTKSAAAKAIRLRKAINDIETACALYEVNSDE